MGDGSGGVVIQKFWKFLTPLIGAKATVSGCVFDDGPLAEDVDPSLH
jgi:hypothetical protein